MNGVARNHCPATGKGASSPMKFSGIARHNAYILHWHPYLFSNYLGKAGKVPLPLGANTRDYTDLAAGLDRHARAFIGTNACRLNKGHNTDAHIFPFSAKPRLFVFDKFFIADHFQRLLHHWQVISSVQDERRKGLIDDLMLIRKSVWRNKIALANFHPVNSQLFGSNIQQALYDEDALRAPGSPNRSGQGFISKNHTDFCCEILNIVPSHRVTLGIERNSQAIRVVGAAIMKEHILQAQYMPIPAQGDLDIVDLPAFLRCGIKIFPAVFDPLDWASQSFRRPWDHQFFSVEHHHFGTKPTADEGSDDSHLMFR